MPYISRFTELFAAIDEDLWTPEQVSELLTVSLEKLAEWRTKQAGPQWFVFVDEVRYSTIELESFIKSVTATPARQRRKQPTSTLAAGVPPWMQPPPLAGAVPSWAVPEASTAAKKTRKRTAAKA